MRPELNTASPPTQHPVVIGDPDIRGFIWMSVSLRINTYSLQSPPILCKDSAIELFEILGEFERGAMPRICQYAARIDEVEQIKQAASRHKDMITSVRSADDPAREYLSRLGLWGEYDSQASAPQNDTTSNRGAHEGGKP